MPAIGATTSVIGVKISCGSNPESKGIDGKDESHIWISFRFPDMPPVQVEIPMYGRQHPKKEEGEAGDNTAEAATRLTAALRSQVESGNITQEQADGILVEEREDPNPKGGEGGKDYYCRIVLEGVGSIDGGSDNGKIRVSGHAGGPVAAGGGGGGGPEPIPVPEDEFGRPLPGWGPGLERLPYPPKGGKCPKDRMRDMDKESRTDEERFLEDSPSSEEQEEEWENWAGDPSRQPGDEREYPDGQWRNQTGNIN